MIWNRDGITWYSEDEVESYKQSEQEGLEIVAELEAENKILKKNVDVFQKYITQNEQLKTEIDCLVKKNDKLKAENDKLKKENETLNTINFRFESKQTSMCEQNKELIDDNLNLSKENEQLKALCDTYRTCYQAKHSDIKCLLPKYRQTLQEIKAISRKTIHIYYPDYYDEGFEEDIVTEFAKQVLDLITKAEEE